MPSRDPPSGSSESNDSTSTSRNPTPPSRDPSVKRTGGSSGSGAFSIARQRSLHSTAGRALPFADAQIPPPPLSNGLEKSSSRSPSNSNSHSRRVSIAPDRSLSRTHSNASVTSISKAPSPIRHGGTQELSSPADLQSYVSRSRPNGLPPLTVPFRDVESSRLQGNHAIPRRTSSQSHSTQRAAGPRFPERTPSLRSNSETIHQSPASRFEWLGKSNLEQFGGGFALDYLLHCFFSYADKLIESRCSTTALLLGDPDLEAYFGKGIDAHFDELLIAIGRISRTSPAHLIEHLIRWKMGHDSQRTSQKSLSSGHSLGDTHSLRSHDHKSDSHHHLDHGGIMNSARVNPELPIYNKDEEYSDKRSCCATFILCRALMEILCQATLDSLGKSSARRLENIIFEGNVKSESINLEKMRSTIHSSKWNKIVEVLGVLSQIEFDGVSKLYLRELKDYLPQLTQKGNVDQEAETKACQIMRGMRYLRPNAHTAGLWISFVDCMLDINDFFSKCHGQRCKNASCRLIESMALKLCGNSSVNFSDERWRKAINGLSEKLAKIAGKPKYWALAYPAQVALSCLSPAEAFAGKWNQMFSSLQSRLKERSSRVVFLRAISRMTWCYLYRQYDKDPSATARNLEEVARNVFLSRRFPLTSEPAVTEPLIELVRTVGHWHPDLCFNKIILPLINSEALSKPREARIETLEPDKMIIGIRSFLSILTDFESKTMPPFPVHFEDELQKLNDDFPLSPILDYPKTSGRSRKKSLLRGERLSEPIASRNFPVHMKDHYAKFCDVLGRITRVCDATFGGQAVLDEKISFSTSRAPVAEAWYSGLGRREDPFHSAEQRQGFYDLLHVAVQAIPRCLAPQTNDMAYLNLLCTGTSHPEEDIAISSAASLKSIARQGHARDVASGFSEFIMKYNSRYSTMSDGGLLGPQHIESTLKLYLEFLCLWINELYTKSCDSPTRPSQTFQSPKAHQLDRPTTMNEIERVESQGLFFLCSPSPRVRSFAVEVLRLVTELDKALGKKESERIYNVLTGDHLDKMHSVLQTLPVFERTILDKAKQGLDGSPPFIRLCSSSDAMDISVWNLAFAELVEAFDVQCPVAVRLTQTDVCARLSQMHSDPDSLMDERFGSQQGSSMDSNSSRPYQRATASTIECNVEQWKLYLIFAFATIKDGGLTISSSSQDLAHARSASRPSQQHGIHTASDLYEKVLPMLVSESMGVRQAAAVGLGSINLSLHHSLLEVLHSQLLTHSGDTRRQFGIHHRGYGSLHGASYVRPYRFQAEVVQVYEQTSRHLASLNLENLDSVGQWVLHHLSIYTQDLARFLNDLNGRSDDLSECFELGKHFCGLVERFYDAVSQTSDPPRWMSFQTRKASIVFVEGCYNLEARDLSQRNTESSNSQATSEIDKIKSAASNAMASLCAGPLRISTKDAEDHVSGNRILGWIEQMLNHVGNKRQATGRRALKNLIICNSQRKLIESVIDRLYTPNQNVALESYLTVLHDVLQDGRFPLVPPWWIPSVLLFLLGHTESNIRMVALRTLQLFEEQSGHTIRLQSFDVGISDKTRVVNQNAHHNIVLALLRQYPTENFHLFSEYSRRFSDFDVDSQITMVRILLPWMQSMQLLVDQRGAPTADSYMVMINLLQVTARWSSVLPHQIQALWQALATGGYAGNIKCMLDFVVGICLSRKDQKTVEMVKQVMVFLHTTEAGKPVLDYFMQGLSPGSIVANSGPPVQQPIIPSEMPYVAKAEEVFTDPMQQISLTHGQLCLILLVDLVVPGEKIEVENLPTLLHVVLSLWDHRAPVVQEQAREMLIHLIHVFVIAKTDNSDGPNQRSVLEDLVDRIRRGDTKVLWSYDDSLGTSGDSEIPSSMSHVVQDVVSLFRRTVPVIEAALGRCATEWALQCRQVHVACRSLQIFRCLATPMDRMFLSHLIEKLSNTMGPETSTSDLHTYAIEVMRTIKAVARTPSLQKSELSSQIFWSTYSCMTSALESEYKEALSTMHLILDNIDLGDPTIAEDLMRTKPVRRQDSLGGLTALLLRGCSTDVLFEPCLEMLTRLTSINSNELVGDDSRHVMILLAHLPRFLHTFDNPSRRPKCIETAVVEANVGRSFEISEWAGLFDDYARGKIRGKDAFFDKYMSLVRSIMEMIPGMELTILKYLMGTLFLPITWANVETLRILKTLIPWIESSRPDIKTQSPDLISPLLRLLQTDLCREALGVLDLVMTLATSDLDKQRLRMSITRSDLPSEERQKFDNVQSLYGIPETSGWYVSNPAATRDSTRRMLQEVHRASFKSDSNSPPLTDNVDKKGPSSHLSDYGILSVTSSVDFAISQTGEIEAFLDSVDEAEDFCMRNPNVAMRPVAAGNISVSQALTQPKRQTNVSNYSNGHLNGSTQFVAIQSIEPSPKRMATRPGMPSRSITSPPGLNKQRSDLTSDDEAYPVGRYDPNQTIRPSNANGKPFSSVRNSFKRLRNSGDRHRRGTTKELSPEVPRVPAEYLTANPQSSEL